MIYKFLDGFKNFVARLGTGTENLLSQSRYHGGGEITQQNMMLESMYRSSWICGAAVDTIAEDMTKSGISITGSVDPEKMKRIDAILTRLGVWTQLLDLVRWGRLYGGAIGLLYIDGQDPETPLNIDTISKGQFKGLRVYDRWQVEPSVNNLNDELLPSYYRINGNALNIHYSRVIRMIGLRLPPRQREMEQYWGESVIERLYDRLVAFDTASAGSANMLFRAHLRTVGIPNLREILSVGGAQQENLTKMFEYMRLLQNIEGVTLLDKEDSFSTHQYNFAGLSDMILQFGQQISGALGIPLVRLFGQSPAGLNSTGESDMRMYYDSILAQQESRLREGITKILALVYRNEYNQSMPQDLDFDFVPLKQLTLDEKVEAARKVAEMVTSTYNSGIIDDTTALLELKQIGESTGVFTNISDELIEESKIEEPPPSTPEVEQQVIIPENNEGESNVLNIRNVQAR